MIIFLDENDVEYGALATIKATNAVNGERSITGEIISGDVVLSRIERGWRLRFEDEYYVVTFAKPIDEGKNVQVSFDAVHQFFWDFGKSSVYDQLNDGSHTFRAYLDFIFNGSGYKYDIETSLTVKAFEKQSFGYKNRLSLFNDIITSSGVEFQVNGKVVRILAKVGTDLSTVVRKNFNLNELGIEKNIGNFVTYQKGFGAYFDEEDHSKGRLIVEYTSPLASVYGKLEADPLVDERYKRQESLLEALKETVDNSYTISVSLDMEDLTRAGYHYTQPVAGDYIMAINETLGFKEKIRIVSFTSEYDVAGQLIKHTVTCNDIGSVKKLSASYTHTQHQAANAEVNANTAYEFANKALVSADGKNTNYYGDAFPVDNPKGTLKKGDLLFLTVGDTVKQYYWNGAEWVINPVVSDVEAFKEQIAEDLKDVPNREEFENKISEEIANSKAEIETQIETAKTQAESNAKEYADTINQETAKVAEQANAAADEIKADLVNVKNNLTATSLVANNAQAAVDEAKQDLTEVASDLNTAKQDLANSVTAVNTKVDSTKAELTQAKQDLTSHAQQLQTQANAQTELTKRVTTVETTANGTKTTVSELSKTVAQNGKDITSVTARTKTVEDDLAGTKTTLSQVKTTADSTSQKTATLETGLNGLTAKFNSLSVGGVNLLTNLPANWQNKYVVISGANAGSFLQQDSTTRISPKKFIAVEAGKEYTISLKELTDIDYYFKVTMSTVDAYGVANSMLNKDEWIYSDTYTFTAPEGCKYVMFSVGCDSGATPDDLNNKFNIKIERGNVATDYSPNYADFEQKVAEYKQTADQNYASLSSTVQTLDGQVQSNKTTAEQTAQGFKTRIESLETYKSGESERANAYFESAKTETAKQLTAERTAIANNYVAKSTYTSDVTGIRNELSATTTTANTTKTNLANYQASNDKVVASLKSSLQTTDGNVSNLQTKVEAVPGQITSAVSAVEGKIPTSVGGTNYLTNISSKWQNKYVVVSGAATGSFNQQSSTTRISPKEFIKVEAGKEYTISLKELTDIDYYFKVTMSTVAAYGVANSMLNRDEWIYRDTYTFTAPEGCKYVMFSVGCDSGATPDDLNNKFNIKIERGNVATDYSPAPEDYDSKLTTAQSEIKQTTDAIKASVSSLDGSTVKSSSLTINADGIVMKAGKSTTDVANAIGSYFAVNQNAINLFSDKINVKGNMIVNGAITSDKIASKSINTAHLNGKIITADVISSNAVTADAIKAGAVTTDKMSANSINGDRITAGTLDAAKIKAGSITASQIASGTITSAQIKTGTISAANITAGAITSDKIASNSIDASKIVTNGLTANIIKGGKLQSLSNATNFELDTGKLFYNNNNTGVFRVQSGASTMGLKFTNTAITVNSSSKVLSRVILGGDRRESTLDDGKWDQGGFTGIVVETINGVASNAHDKADTLRAIGDNIYFTHSYETDALTGVSAAGWKMETYAPDTSYKGNVVLKPYGVSYRQSNIVVGDLRLDNGDGSGYWMRATINVLKACFGHIVNGGISSDALNAIKSELNKISGT